MERDTEIDINVWYNGESIKIQIRAKVFDIPGADVPTIRHCNTYSRWQSRQLRTRSRIL